MWQKERSPCSWLENRAPSPEGSVPPGRHKNCCLAVLLDVLIPQCSPEDTLVYIVLVTKNSGLHETKTIRTTAAEKQKEFY